MATKKFFLLLAMALLPLSSVCVSAFGEQVQLQVRIEDPNDGQDNPHRGPILIPEVSIEDTTLTFDDSCIGTELRIVDENGIVMYNTIITSYELELPSSLFGEYELRIISGVFCFYGDITL